MEIDNLEYVKPDNLDYLVDEMNIRLNYIAKSYNMLLDQIRETENMLSVQGVNYAKNDGPKSTIRYVRFKPMDQNNVRTRMLFEDASDGQLKYKDKDGIIIPL